MTSLQRDAAAAMRTKGLISGDDAELDRTLKDGAARAKRNDLEGAAASFTSAIARAASLTIDRALVEKKLARLNARFDKEKNPAIQARLDAAALKATEALAAGRIADANRVLNSALSP